MRDTAVDQAELEAFALVVTTAYRALYGLDQDVNVAWELNAYDNGDLQITLKVAQA